MSQTDGRTNDRRILTSWALLTQSSRAKNAIESYKNNATQYVQLVSYESFSYVILLRFIPFLCGFTEYFETSVLNNPIMTLITTNSKVPHICSTSTPDPYLTLFQSMIGYFELPSFFFEFYISRPSRNIFCVNSDREQLQKCLAAKESSYV